MTHDPLCTLRYIEYTSQGPVCQTCELIRRADERGFARGYSRGYDTADGRWSDAVKHDSAAYRKGYNDGVRVKAKSDWMYGVFNQHGAGENP